MVAVYIVDRDGELDVYAGLEDAQRAVEILNKRLKPWELPYSPYAVNEQVVFESSKDKLDDGTTPAAQAMETMRWLKALEREVA